jgi:biotin operon repressor
MSMRSFPALGFDPTPGETGSVQAVVLAMSRALHVIGDTTPRLQEAVQLADDADWLGDAADQFADSGADLPQSMSTGADAIAKAAEALSKWGGQMKANQDKAEELEDKAKKLKKQIAAANDAVTSAAGAIPHDTTSPHYAARYNAFLGAVDAASDLDAQLEQVIADAHRLQAKHLREANAAADGVRSGSDDAFKPHEDEAWYVTALDDVAKVSGIVSAATGFAAAGLAITGVGAPAAAVLGTVSAGTAGVTALAGIGQRIAGSPNAPSNLSLALTVIPGRTFTSAAAAGAKGLARPLIGSSRLVNGAKGAASGAADGFVSGGLPKLAKDVAETGKYARQTGSLRDGLKLKAATDGVGQVLKGDAKLAGEAYGNAVDATVRTIEASGGHVSIEDKRELEALKLLANPHGDAAENAVVNTVRNELNEHHKK